MTNVWLYTEKRKLKNGRRCAYRVLRWRVGGKMRATSLGPKSKVTMAEAREARRKKELELAQGAAATYAGKRLRLSEVSEAYGRARDAAGGDHAYSVRHAIDALGDLHVDRVTPQHVVDLRIHLKNKTSPRTKRTLAPATVIKTLRQLRAMWNWSQRQGFVGEAAKNPFSAEPIGNPDPKEPRIFTRVDQAAMEGVLEGRIAAPFRSRDRALWQRWLVLLHLAFATGLRKNELLHLRWEDIDFDGGMVRVRNHREPLPFRLKTRGSVRSVPIDEALVRELLAHRARCGGSAYLFIPAERVTLLLRRLAAGKTIGKTPVGNTHRQFKGIQKAAELHPLGSIHDARKTCLTNWARSGVAMHVVKEYAGHSSITTTATYYLKTTEDDAARVREVTKRLRAG